MSAIQYFARCIPSLAMKADLLFKLLADKSFHWESQHEKCWRSLLNFLATDAVVRPFSHTSKSVLITDASIYGIGAVVEQNEHPVLCISRKLLKAEQGNAQTMLEALAIHWAVQRLHKFLFNTKLSIATDHSALKFIFDTN